MIICVLILYSCISLFCQVFICVHKNSVNVNSSGRRKAKRRKRKNGNIRRIEAPPLHPIDSIFNLGIVGMELIEGT